MTAQVHGSRMRGTDTPPKNRRKKVTAFALAGLVASAGIAGVVVTSSAYFTDTKQTDVTVTTRSVTLNVKDGATQSALAPIALTDLAPLTAATPAEFATAPTRSFFIENAGTSKFSWKIEVTDIQVLNSAGTTTLSTTTTPNTGEVTLADAKDAIKVNVVDLAYAANPTVTYTAANGKTLTTLTSTPEILASSANLEKSGTAADADKRSIGVRVWVDQATLSANTAKWTTDYQNALQKMQVKFKLKITATQVQ
ncbi:hypothetical protein [Herbiconiux sp. L3-i23]|uniref:hypothetical protein n=1 Tax=Herbiconiux sp. L3-i23 TaxID=2905871 RepID=UPI0020652D9A|nr:hypothetical protein [Herbiconiux sp. L3-i23]BDI23896.1 hypothetical protein L3i23_26720 [Herbiconiux sp. L3-i23]